MKLNKFIDELKKISKESDKTDCIEVKMADNIPVVRPVLKNGVVYITDIDKEST